MPHLPNTDVHTYRLHGVTFNSFASTATGSTSLAAWRADFEPGVPGQAHSMDKEEILYVVRGSLTVALDGRSFTAQVGDAIRVPAGADLCVANRSAEPASAWVVTGVGMTATMTGGDTIAPPWAQ